MLYESYKNKLEKRRRRFERLWRFRLLFVIIFLLMLAAAAALMGVKGTVTEVSVPERFAYGERLSMEASSVFGGAGFEYRLQGTETWSEKMPRAAGTYECRAVGKSIVGTNRPGDIHLFTIDPVEAVVRVSDGDLVYGEAPSFTANLCYDDILRVASYTVEERSGGYNIVADPDAISVLSAEGEDVTASYLFEVKDRDVKEIARPITVKTESAAVEYDGLPHAAEALTLEGYGLAAGHHIEAEFAAMVDAGECSNRPVAFAILDENGDDVTDKYEVEYEYGTLEVTRRPLTVTTASASIVYDGTAHTYGDIAAAGLAAGQTAVRSDALSAQNAGEYKNTPHYDIYDGERRTTDNYAITEDFGTVTVTKRPLTVTTQSDKILYDGTAHPYDDIAAEGLAGEQTVSRLGALSVRDAGEYANEPQFIIYDGDDRISTDNYDITRNYGTVTVTKRAVTVTMKGEEILYDGTAHEYNTDAWYTLEGELAADEWLELSDTLTARLAGTYVNRPTVRITATRGETSANYEITVKEAGVTIAKRLLTVTTATDDFVYNGEPHIYDEVGFGETVLMGDDEIRLSGNYTFTEANAEPYPNRPSLAVFCGEEDVTESYEIVFTYGTVTISPRHVKFRTDSLTGVEYDGAPHSAPHYADLGEEAGPVYKLVGLHTLDAAFPSLTDAGSRQNIPENVRILCGGAEIALANYQIEWEYGTLEIVARAVTLRTATPTGEDSITYDGQPHGAPSYSAVGTQLVDGHTVEAAFKQWTDANEEGYENSLDEDALKAVKIRDADGNDVTGNYAVTWEWGTVVIHRRDVTLRAGDYHAVYDGKAHTAEVWSVESGSLAEGHYAAGTFNAFTDAGSYDNDPDGKAIYDGAGTPVTPNYNATWKAGSIVIDLRPLTVTAHGGSWEYDAAAHSEAGYDVEGLADGHVYKANVTAPQIVNVWDSRVNELVFGEVFIGPEGGDDCGKNYDVTYVRTKMIQITPRPITVTTKGDTIVYDGTEHTYASAEVTSEKQLAAETHRLVLEGFSSFLDARETPYSNEMTVKVYADGEDITENYEITPVYGAVKIDRRPITVLTHDCGPYVYDGISWRDTDYENCTVVYPEGAPKLEGHEVEIEYTGKDKMAHVGTHEIAFTARIVAEVYGDVTENYDVTIAFGEVEITLRPLHIQTQTDVFTYDGTEHRFGVDTLELLDGTTRAPGQDWRIMDEEKSYYFFTEVRGKDAEGNATAYDNTPVVHIFDEAGEDVTDNYDITYDYGTVTVLYRPLHVTSGTKSFVYDDEPHDDRTYTITDTENDTGLAPGQTLTVIASTVLTDVEEKENKLTYHITDLRNADVTKNYDITEENGTISVTVRHVKFLSGSLMNQEYDADPHGAPTYTDLGSDDGPIYKLVKNHEVSAQYPTRTVVGKEDNIPENVRIVKGGADVTGNYVIEAWEFGEIEILVRQVTLQTHSGSFVYDARPHDVQGYDEVVNTLVSSHGHTLFAAYPDRTTVGATTNMWTQVRIREGDDDVTDNYEITWEPWGEITITPRPVTITSDGGEHVYNDEDFSISTYSVEDFNEAGQTGLVAGHEFTAIVTAPVLHDVETRLNELEYAEVKVTADGADVTENYTFTYAVNAIAVTARPVTIQRDGGTFVYDGNPHKVGTYTVEESDGKDRGILTEKGHVFSADEVDPEALYFVTDVSDGTRPNIFYLNNMKVTAGERDVTENYDIGYGPVGMLRITPRPVTVTLHGGEWIYCGVPKTCEDSTAIEKAADFEDRGLLEGHEVQLTYATFLNAGTYPQNGYSGTPRVVDAGGSDLTANYTVEVQIANDRIVIWRRAITVSDLVGGTWVYDGLPHSSDPANFTCEEENGERGLLKSLGHEFRGAAGIEVTNITDIMEDGVYTQVGYAENGIKNEITHQQSQDTWYIAYLYDAEGNDIWENYKVEPGTFAPLRVKSPIVVYVFSHTKRYDGTPLTYDPSQENYYIAAKPADVEENWIRVVLGGSLTEVGYLTPQQVGGASRGLCTVTSGDADLTAQNRFDFTGPERALEVQRRILRVRAADVNVDPSAETFTYEGDEKSYWFTFGGPLEGHTFSCKVHGVLTPEEDKAVIELTDIRIVDGEGNDVTGYYEVDVTPGTLRWVEAAGGGKAAAAVADIKQRIAE